MKERQRERGREGGRGRKTKREFEKIREKDRKNLPYPPWKKNNMQEKYPSHWRVGVALFTLPQGSLDS